MAKWLIAALLLFAFVPLTLAQRGGGFRHGGTFSKIGFGAGFPHSQSRGFGRSAVFLGDPFWWDDYPAGSTAYAPQPVVVLQQPPASNLEPERLAEPLLIEWQGDRYVRVSSARSSATDAPDYMQKGPLSITRTEPNQIAISERSELPPAILIFRDGHREQVSDYVIARGVLYARADYALTGSSTRDIQLASLDLTATLKANQKTGSKFVLPQSPNEVVTRP